MPLEKIGRLPYLKRQPRSDGKWHSFCDGVFTLNKQEIASFGVFPEPAKKPNTDKQPELAKKG